MASLFNRKAKPFKHEEDDEVQIKITAKKPTSTKRAIVDLLDDSSGDEIDVKKKLKCDDDVIDLSTDSVVDYKEQARAKVRALAESSKATRVEPIDIDSPSPEKADVANAKALLKQIGASKKNAAKKPVAQVVDDVDVEQYVVPKIAPSLPRAASTPLPSTINAAEYLSRLTGARSARISATPQATAEKPQCKLKTRLNGVHERKWKIAFDESFGKVKAKFAAVYGLKVGDIKFEFDGETIKDTHTPGSLDMEDDNMIDVKIDKALYAAAVATADAQNAAAQPTSSSSSNSSALPPRPEPAVAAGLRLRTRLNGQHEWKWRIAPTDTFAKVRSKYAELYGLKVGDIKFEFDGETIKDTHTPGSMDMEDDNMIDVKIDKKLYAAAVDSADAKR